MKIVSIKTAIKATALSAFILAYSGASNALTMDESVTLAVQNSHTVKRFEYLQQSARQKAESAKSTFMPALSLSYSHSQTEHDSKLDTQLGPQTVSALGIEAAYNVFNGMSDYNTLMSTRSLLESSTYDRKTSVQDAVFNAKSSYISALKAEKLAQTAREYTTLLEKHRQDAEKLFEQGLITRSDVLKVDVELASAKQQMLQAESAYRLSRVRLGFTIGRDIEADEALSDLNDAPEPADMNDMSVKERMLGERSELKKFDSLLQSYSYSLKSIRGGYMPRIDIALSRTFYDNDNYWPEAADDTRAAVSLRWALFDGLYKMRKKGEIIAQQNAVNEQKAEAGQALELSLMEALENYRTSRGSLQVAQAAILQAEENLRLVQSRFKESAATTTDLLDAETNLTRAKNQYFIARYDIHLSLSSIDRMLENAQ